LLRDLNAPATSAFAYLIEVRDNLIDLPYDGRFPRPILMTSPTHDPNELLSRSLSRDELPEARHSLDLLALAQGGNRQALEDLVGRYQGRIRRIVRIQLGASVLRRDYDSMDIVQSTFKAALPKICDLHPRSAAGLLQWLALIATNKIRDLHDRQQTGKRDTALEVPIEHGPSARVGQPQLSGGGAPPDEEAMLREVRDLLDDEVAQLPEDQRRAVILRDYCGEEWEHIAVELDRDNGATRQLHQRAWIHLRRALRPKLMGRE
jgi:RNA polymerase sigma factor (sigma-70 family)